MENENQKKEKTSIWTRFANFFKTGHKYFKNSFRNIVNTITKKQTLREGIGHQKEITRELNEATAQIMPVSVQKVHDKLLKLAKRKNSRGRQEIPTLSGDNIPRVTKEVSAVKDMKEIHKEGATGKQSHGSNNQISNLKKILDKQETL